MLGLRPKSTRPSARTRSSGSQRTASTLAALVTTFTRWDKRLSTFLTSPSCMNRPRDLAHEAEAEASVDEARNDLVGQGAACEERRVVP